MAFANGSNTAYDQMVQVEPGIWLIPGVAYHYLRAKWRYNRERGASFRSTEGFRPLGHPGDYDDRPNTQWYYWERKIAKPSSPSGAYPGGSMHGWGRAVDVNLNDDINYSRMRAFMEDEGFVFDIDDEPWHANYYGSDMWTAYDLSFLDATGIDPQEEDPMAQLTADDIKNAMVEALKTIPQPSNPPKRKTVVFGAEFYSGDDNIDGIGQANGTDPGTGQPLPAGADWGNYYLIDWDDYSYTWLVTGGNINRAQDIYGPATRVDSAFFIGMSNAFSRDAVDHQPGEK